MSPKDRKNCLRCGHKMRLWVTPGWQTCSECGFLLIINAPEDILLVHYSKSPKSAKKREIIVVPSGCLLVIDGKEP